MTPSGCLNWCVRIVFAGLAPGVAIEPRRVPVVMTAIACWRDWKQRWAPTLCRRIGDRMNRRLWPLLIAHVVAGVGFCVWASTHLVPPVWDEPVYFSSQYVLPTALVTCESFLLAFWAAMSDAALWKRLIGLVVGMVYLECLIAFSVQYHLFELRLTLSTGMVAVAFFFARRWQIVFHRIADRSTHENLRGLRSLIKGLIVLTPAVAVLIAFSIVCRHSGIFSLHGYFFPTFRFAVFGLAWLCLVVIDVASLWATLKYASSIARSIVVIVASIILAWCYSYAFASVGHSYYEDAIGRMSGFYFGPDRIPLAAFFTRFSSYWCWYAYIFSVTFLQTLALIGSLQVIRSCGYRLNWPDPDDVKLHRQFQFNLRKLMLWMVVWGAYLSLCRLMNVGAHAAVIATLWFAVVVAIRLKWSLRQGWKIATCTGLGFSVVLAAWIGLSFCRSGSATLILSNARSLFGVFVVGGILIGPFVALYTFIAADLVVRAVDWLDALMQTKTPPATDNPVNQTQRPDAASSEE